MAIVVSPIDHMTVLGVVTLEDVIEELIQEEIYDESDLTIQQSDKNRKSTTIMSPLLLREQAVAVTIQDQGIVRKNRAIAKSNVI